MCDLDAALGSVINGPSGKNSLLNQFLVCWSVFGVLILVALVAMQ